LLHIKMGVVERDTPIRVSRTRTERVRKFPAQRLGGRASTVGRAQHHQRHRRVKRVFEPSRMCRAVVECQKRLVGLRALPRRGGQRARRIVQASRHIARRFPPMPLAAALGTLHRLMVHLQAPTDGGEVMGGEGPAALRDQGRGRARAPTGRGQDPQRPPRASTGATAPARMVREEPSRMMRLHHVTPSTAPSSRRPAMHQT